MPVFGGVGGAGAAGFADSVAGAAGFFCVPVPEHNPDRKERSIPL